MFQCFIPGFERIDLSPEIASEMSILDVEKTMEYFESKGFEYLVDWSPESKNECYVPERFKTPTGMMLDEDELIEMLKKKDRSSEIADLYIYYLSICHPSNSVEIKEYRTSFLDENDMQECFRKYHGKTISPVDVLLKRCSSR